jgi:Flp pilus assembly protein TadG
MKRLNPTMKDQTGAVAVTVAILMFALVGFAALAIDIGYLLVTRNELQNVADAAALAAAGTLGNNYRGMTRAEQLDYDCASSVIYPCSEIIEVAQQVGLANRAAGVNISILENEVEIGLWDAGATPPFSTSTVHPNAVRVTARRDETSNSSITTFLAGVIGVDTLAVSAFATAALTPQSTVEEGELELPVGISREWIDGNPEFCNDRIRFSPTNSTDSCAGWTSWTYDPPNDNKLREILDLDDPLINPKMGRGDIIEFTGGKLGKNTFDALETLFQHHGYDVMKVGDHWEAVAEDGDGPITGSLDPVVYPEADPICEKHEGDTEPYYSCSDGIHTTPLLYPDGTPRNRHQWDTKVVVYESDNCLNPVKPMAIAGFAMVTVTEVLNAPDKSIVANVICEMNDTGVSRGGGGSPAGILGSIPGLVQ